MPRLDYLCTYYPSLPFSSYDSSTFNPTIMHPPILCPYALVLSPLFLFLLNPLSYIHTIFSAYTPLKYSLFSVHVLLRCVLGYILSRTSPPYYFFRSSAA